MMKSAWAPVAAVLFLSASAAPVWAADGVCPAHAGRLTLSGVLVERTYAGPPNYRDISKGDAADTVWLIHFDRKTCVGTPPDDMHAGPVQEVQLDLDPAKFVRERGHLGRRVRVSGKPSSAEPFHFHTPVILLDVRFEG